MEAQQKENTLDLAISQIEKQFGQGAIMRMGEDTIVKMEGISTGSLSLNASCTYEKTAKSISLFTEKSPTEREP